MEHKTTFFSRHGANLSLETRIPTVHPVIGGEILDGRELTLLISDYRSVTPHSNNYYIPYIYQRLLPTRGSVEYYCLLQELKFLELQGKFNPDSLKMFTFKKEPVANEL